ncbi:MAG: P-II family nitrogen regulator [Solirubrobacterales bacterium]
MKKIEAFVRHEAFDPIRRDLLDSGVPSMSVTDVKGSGRQKGVTEHYRGAELVIHLRPKLKIECVVDDSEVEKVVDIILNNARTGEVGDGKIFIIPVEETIRIRTGERGDDVLKTHLSQEQE